MPTVKDILERKGSQVFTIGKGATVLEAAPAREHCPGSSYSRLHYWTPALWRLHACLHGPKAPTYAPDRFPDVPPTYKIIGYPCPAVDPATMVHDWRLAP